MTNIIIIVIILTCVGGAIVYILREKRRGVKCIGCPHAKECANRGKCSVNKISTVNGSKDSRDSAEDIHKRA